METYRTWVRLFELQRYYSWIIDRFHVSTQVYQYVQNHKEYDFGEIDRQLADLGFRHVLCTRDPKSFTAARQTRLRVSGKPSQYGDLQRFVEEQKLFREFIQRSALPSIAVDVSDGNIDRITAQIADWLEESGGLYMA